MTEHPYRQQYRHAGPPPPHAPQYFPQPPRNGLAIAAVTVGAIGCLFGLIPLTFWIAGTLGAVALGLGFAARGRVRRGEADNRRTALAGIAIGGAALVFATIGAAIFFSTMSQLDRDLERMSDEFESAAPAPYTPPRSFDVPTPAPPAPAAPDGITEGVYLVGVDVEPGTYRTAGPADSILPSCYWERLSGTSGGFDELIANDIGEGPMVVTIKASDVAFSTNGCQPWTRN